MESHQGSRRCLFDALWKCIYVDTNSGGGGQGKPTEEIKVGQVLKAEIVLGKQGCLSALQVFGRLKVAN